MKMYEILKCEGKSGLTVGQRSLPPGRKFSEKDWAWGEKALDAAIKNKRCKMISDVGSKYVMPKTKAEISVEQKEAEKVAEKKAAEAAKLAEKPMTKAEKKAAEKAALAEAENHEGIPATTEAE